MRSFHFTIGTLALAVLSACSMLAPPKSAATPASTSLVSSNAAAIVVVPQPPVVIIQKEVVEPKVIVNQYIGKTIDEVIKVIGQPIGSADMGNNVQAFQFFANPKRPDRNKCVVSYLAKRENDTKPWIVQEYIAPDPKTCIDLPTQSIQPKTNRQIKHK